MPPSRSRDTMGPASFALAGRGVDELVAETLVVPFCVIVHYVFGYRCPQVSLTERYEAGRDTLDVWRERIFPRMRSDSDYSREGEGASRLNLSTAQSQTQTLSC